MRRRRERERGRGATWGHFVLPPWHQSPRVDVQQVIASVRVFEVLCVFVLHVRLSYVLFATAAAVFSPLFVLATLSSEN